MKGSHRFEDHSSVSRARSIEARKALLLQAKELTSVTSMNEASTSACAASRRGAAPTKRRAASYGLALSLGLAALVPKCPMCLAAYLSLVGLGGGLVAAVHPVLRPLSVALVALALGAVLIQRRRG